MNRKYKIVTHSTASELKEILFEKGVDVQVNDVVSRGVHNILGSSIMDLRHLHNLRQERKKQQKSSYDSDSDSENTLEESLSQLSNEDLTWFRGCGFHLTIDTSILFSQILIALILIIFCVFKLLSSDDCSVQGTYAPILTGIIGYFFSKPLSIFKNKIKTRFKNEQNA